MKKIVSLLRLDFLPEKPDLALLLLRLWFGGSLLILHGWGKLSSFNQMAGKFADPLKIGSHASLALVVFAEALCALLIALGFFTRTAALVCAINMSVAFFMVHKGRLSGSGSGEMAFIYLAGFVAILVAGPGRFALDRSSKSGGSAPRKPKPAN